jgi:hypothetical protein
MRKIALAASLVALAAFAVRVGAHPGHEHKAVGTLAVVDASHVEVKTQDGKTISVELNAETKYAKGKAAASAADLKVSQRVAVSYVEKDGKNVATQVLLGVTEGAPSTKVP